MSDLVLSLDYTDPSRNGSALADGLDNVARIGMDHVRLKPPGARWADVSAYVTALLEPVQGRHDDVVLVSHCLSYGLAGEVARHLERNGCRLRGVVAVDPQRPRTERLREAYRMIQRQLPRRVITPESEQVLTAEIADVYAGLGAAVESLTEPLLAVAREFLDGEQDSGAADQLVAHYRTWLNYCLACYGGYRTPSPVPVTVAASAAYQLADAGLREQLVVSSRCPGDVVGCACLPALVAAVHTGDSPARADRHVAAVPGKPAP